MKHLLAIALLLCVSVRISAQTPFVPGYLVKNNGDTLHGYLQKQTSTDLLFSLAFKPDNINAPSQSISPGDIRLFKYLTGNFYAPITFINTYDGTSVSQTGFALQLVTGAYSLYAYTAGDKTFFVIINNGSSYLLYNTDYNTDGSVNKEGNYVSRLGVIASSCANNHLVPELVGFTAKDMSAFIFAVNKCIAPNTAYSAYVQSPNTSVQASIYAGGLIVGSHESQFTADAALRLTLPKMPKNLYLDIGIHFSYTGKLKKIPDYANTTYTMTIQDYIFCFPMTLQYTFTSGRIRPYIVGGIGLTYLHEHTLNPDNNFLKFVVPGIGEAGIEGHITDNFFIKAAWRYELLAQYPSVGLGYSF